MTKVQTLTEIRAMLDAAGIKPQHRFGQNFFVDGNLLRRMVDAADIDKHDTVLEVGGGTGVLTDLLAAACSWLIVYEIDRALAHFLTDRFAAHPHVQIHCGDVLKSKHQLSEDLVRLLNAESASTAARLMLVANLPYNVATPLLIDLILAIPRMTRFVFTVQKEVAERMAARPKTKAYGPVSILVQALCDVRTIAQVPPQSFWPRPKIESQMLRLDRKPDVPISPERVEDFSRLLKTGFAHRRKTLAYNLKATGLSISKTLADSKVRPEELGVQEWVDLFLSQGQ